MTIERVTSELREYTPEQQDRFLEFYRATTIYAEVQKHELEIAKGIPAIIQDPITRDSILTDYTAVKVIRGALRGMLSEMMDLGLRYEISALSQDIQSPPNPI